ncbi:MAG TPA: pantetheine-phosphate adenylyltransferase [Hyphomonas sp.]|nr:pantetheine-phosphate adenylyltransferase [Hyphomonas sp.]MCA8905495.1 pantetheine-phosphate adenylyltransferase [Hyphomonas sp.]MCB9962551.1 pantetheine-phosphate adenylyltransferase [Hyphomonas sp.]MCB9971997.1 pantetheine-phosphate adenylyltransferase [Hyphomonas sp.]HPE47442.1 pantetheine-phosphate adenylyltransferase [Hyphomonas sp.]
MHRIGLYPGTFDPPTIGHVDIIGRARKLVDTLIIGVAVNEAKKPLFTLQERVAMVRSECEKLNGPGLAEIKVMPMHGLLMKFAEACGAGIIVRGLRAVQDFEYEFQMTAMNEQLNPDIETVFLMADVRHQAVASRLVKEIVSLGGDITPFVTPAVKEALLEKFPPKG